MEILLWVVLILAIIWVCTHTDLIFLTIAVILLVIVFTKKKDE